MKTTILDSRTVAIVKDLDVQTRHGANGEFESKTILFRIAVDRDYKTTRTENGKTISEYPTDFWLAKATGAVAQAFADNCTAKRDDGKLISRHLLLNGNFENYQSTRKQTVKSQPQVNINGQVYQLSLDLEVDVPTHNTIFVIDNFKFLDKKPEKMAANTGTTVSSVSSVTPIIAQPAQTQPQVQLAPAQQQPIQYQQPAPVGLTQMITPIQQGQALAVDPNFVVTGEDAPF